MHSARKVLSITDHTPSARPSFGRRLLPGLERRFEEALPPALRSSRLLARAAARHGALQKTEELGPLLRLLRARSLHVVVEIGTKDGGTFYSLCQIADPEALLVSIDLPGGEFGGGYDEDAIPRMRGYGRKGQALHFLRSDSHERSTVSDLVRILAGRPIDFLFIDGDHTYGGVKADFEMYAPLVADGGLVAFHDVLPHPQEPECQVEQYWSEIRGQHACHEFLYPEDDRGWGQWGGIGVLEIPRG